MKRTWPIVLAAGLFLSSAAAMYAQLDFNVFQKSAIASVFHPIVGHGAVYQTTRTGAPTEAPTDEEISAVAKDTAEGKEGFWIEISRQNKNAGGITYVKMFITKDDFQFRRMVMQAPGQQAMEMPFHPTPNAKADIETNMKKWHVVGTETISVPAGTYSCQHWSNDSGNDIWTSDKVTPFGAVKQVSGSETKVLTKLITDAQDHITGPVKVFDPQAMQQQMLEQMQKRKQPPN
jgi:hypothetical protein